MKTPIFSLVTLGLALFLALGVIDLQSQASSCYPPPAGMVGWWPAEGNANDNTGNNDGTLLGGLSYARGEVGQAFDFNQTNEAVFIPASASLDVGAGSGFTVEGWINPTDVTQTHAIFEWNNGNYFGVHFHIAPGQPFNSNPGPGELYANLPDGNGLWHQLSSPGGVVVSNLFQHVALTYDETSGLATIYCNGQIVAQQNLGSFIPATHGYNLYLGLRVAPGGYSLTFAGLIDEPTVYNRALTASEIQAIYNAGSGGKCALTGPTGPPVISSISPTTGVDGSTITILGTNFNSTAAANIVYFGAVQANVQSASPTSLTVSVPSGATFAPVTVTEGGWTAYSETPFEPTFNGSSAPIDATTFTNSFDLPTPNGPIRAAIADLDGDGRPDVVVADNYAGVVSIFQNIGTNGQLNAGTFASPITLTMENNSTPNYLVAADLNGDGKLDLVLSDSANGQIVVFQNVSSGGLITTNSFAAPVYFPVGADASSVAVRDLDGDGFPDIVCVNQGNGTVSILRNTGLGGNITTNSFAAHVDLPMAGTGEGLAAGDLDGDGKPDLAVADSSGFISLFHNNSTPGTISFGPRVDLRAQSGSLNVAIGDLDGDGKPELITTAYLPTTMSVYQNLSTPGSLTTNSFAAEVDYGLAGRGHTIALSDLTGNGKLDITEVTEINSALSFFQNVGSGSFTSSSLASRVDYPTGYNAWGVAVGDLNGDGRPDVAFCNQYDNTIQFYENVAPFGMPPAAPTITIQPTNLTVTVGGTAVLNVVATGSAPLAYQWNFDGNNLAGATNATLTLTNVSEAEAGNYFVTVSNLLGGGVSSNVVLTVFVPPTPPEILAQSPNQIVLLNNPATFDVMAGGSTPLSYFWSRNGVPIPNATNSSYTLSSAQLSDSGSTFSCLITNLYGSTSTTNASLKVIDSTIANDLCSGAIVIANGSYTNYQSTVAATSYGDPVPDCVDGFGHGVWYEFTAPVTGLMVVDTFGSDFDTGLGIYTGSCDSLTEAGCNDDFGGITSQVTLPTTAGTTYYIIAGGYDSDAGDLVLHLNFLSPPVFITEPTNISPIVNGNASLSATLSGSSPISFQWYFNKAPLTDGGGISGSLTPTLAIAGVTSTEGGNYFLEASNIVGVTTSSVAVLTPIILPPVLLVTPASQSVVVGSNADFFAVIGGSPPFNFQWYLNGNPLVDDGIHIVGSATASLTISNLTMADAGSYSLTVTNVSGSTSAAATLTVLVPPSITLNPVGRSVPPGLPTIFTGGETGIPTPTYQWRLNGTNLPGATSANYTNAGIGMNDLGYYQLIASNSVGVTASSNAQLTFGPVAAWGLNASGESLPPPGLSNVTEVAGGFEASFALRADGTIVPWGSLAEMFAPIPSAATNVVELAISSNPQGGAYALRSDGTVISWPSLPAPPLSNIVQVAAGYSFGLALRAEGTVVGWGIAPYSTVPAGLNHVTAIACGYNQSLALRNNGTVVGWGNGPSTNIPAGLANVTAIAEGYSYSLALTSNGTVVAWGSGTGTNLPAGLTNVVAIATENTFSSLSLSLALRANGTVVAWGDNTYGESTPPGALSNLLSVAISAGYDHGLALVNNGSVQFLQMPVGQTAYVGRNVTLQAGATGAAPLSYQWLLNGTNISGATNSSLVISNLQFANAGSYQLLVSNSINTAISLPAPLTVVSNSTLMFLAQMAGTTNYQGATISLGSPGVLGNGPLSYQWFFSTTNRNYVAVSGATNDALLFNPALAGESGNYYIAVSNLFGGVTSAPVNVRVMFEKAWGYFPVDAQFVLTNATAIAVGNSGVESSVGAYYALSSAGKLSSWTGGQVAYGETNFSALSNYIVTAVAAGIGDTLALKSDGTLFAIGNNAYGETNVPAAAAVGGITAIACGDYHDLALNYLGTVFGWGQNTYQQTTNTAATNVVAIAAGGANSIALRADGSVVTWGQFGNNLYPEFPIPPTTTNIIAVAAGETHFLALRANGTVVGWGENTYGQTTIPANWTNIVAISAAGNHSTVLHNDGTVSVSGAYFPYQANSATAPPDLANVIAIAGSGEHDLALFGTRAPVFTVQPWDRSIPANVVTNITIAAKCSGVQPVHYQWQLDGTNIVNATNDTLSLGGKNQAGGQINIPIGDYQLIASNAYGVAASKYMKISVFIPLGVALDATNLGWTTSGDALWYGETNITHDGVAAAQSGGIGPFQQTILQTTVGTNYAGSYSFWWKVSSEQDFDFLEFRINGNVQTSISGEVNWQQVSIPVPAGTNVLLWRYYKDDTIDVGQDAGWVADFTFIPGPPVINVQPQPAVQTVNWGTNVIFTVSAAGAPPMRYIWRQNGNPIGGNSPLLVLNNVGRAQSGTYSVIVTNVGGSTLSSSAVLNVLVPQLLSSPQILPNGGFQFTSIDIDGGLLSPADLANFGAQASTDLVNWVTLPGALSLTNGMLLLQDNETNFSTRYYRILEY